MCTARISRFFGECRAQFFPHSVHGPGYELVDERWTTFEARKQGEVDHRVFNIFERLIDKLPTVELLLDKFDISLQLIIILEQFRDFGVRMHGSRVIPPSKLSSDRRI